MRTTPFYDTWQFVLGNTGDHDGSGVKYFLVFMFLALVVAGIAIA